MAVELVPEVELLEPVEEVLAAGVSTAGLVLVVEVVAGADSVVAVEEELVEVGLAAVEVSSARPVRA